MNDGLGEGPAVVLSAPISFMGGVDPATGVIVDLHHPEAGTSLAGAVVFMPGTKGSSGTSPVLLECIRQGTAPAAIVLSRPSPILLVGAYVGRELYGARLPIVLDEDSGERPTEGAPMRVDVSGDDVDIAFTRIASTPPIDRRKQS